MMIEDLPPALQEQAREKLGLKRSKYNAELGRSIIRSWINMSWDRNKYNNKFTYVDGIRFSSRKEAERYAVLKLLEKAGAISDLVLQPRFTLQESFVYAGKKERKIEYVADFQYMQGGNLIVEDVKGLKTPVYKLKRKLFLNKYGSDIIFKEV